MIRVVMVVHGYPPKATAGAEGRAERTARQLLQQGCEVAVVYPVYQDEANWAQSNDRVQDGVLVRQVALPRKQGRTSRTLSPYDSAEYDNPIMGAAVAEFAREWQPSVVHLLSGYVTSASVVQSAVECSVPVVVSLTDFWWFCHRINLLLRDGSRCDGPSPAACARCHAEQFRRFRLMTNVWPGLMDWTWDHAASSARLRRQLGFSEQERRAQHLRQTLSMADALIAPSQFLANFYIRQGVDAGRIHVWRQGVQMPAPITRTSSPELRIGYIGQIKPHKGVDLLVDAWAMLRGDRPRRLLLYGSDSGEPEYGNRIRSTITTLSSAEWRGTYRGSEVWDILAGLDLVVIPSRWVENSPNSILESQAARVPLIGANLGGMSELIRHEHNGLLFEVDNAGSLANQLQRVLDEPKLLPEMRARSIPVRTVEQEVAQLVSLYENLLTHPRTSSPDTVPALSGAQ